MCSIREAKSKKSPATSDECIHCSRTSDEYIHCSRTSDECIDGFNYSPLLFISRLNCICQLPKHIENALFKGPSSAAVPDAALVKQALIEAHLITNSTVTV
jgi:hypothetical protein